MDHPEVLGSASASEVPARPPGSGYNFRPRSRSATATKNRRLGSVETQGVGSTLDLPAVTPPNSPTPSGAGNPTHGNTKINNPTIISHDSTTESSPPLSTLIPDTGRVGVSSYNCTFSFTTRQHQFDHTAAPVWRQFEFSVVSCPQRLKRNIRGEGNVRQRWAPNRWLWAPKRFYDTPNWPVALFLLLLHPPGTLYLLTFDCAKTFSLSNVTWKPIYSNSLSPPVLHQAPLYLQT